VGLVPQAAFRRLERDQMMPRPTPSALDRDQLIHDHIKLPRLIARTRASTSHEAFEDLLADGNAGLVQAAHTYDPSRGASFRTYAWFRIRGAMLDGARRLPAYARPLPSTSQITDPRLDSLGDPPANDVHPPTLAEGREPSSSPPPTNKTTPWQRYRLGVLNYERLITGSAPTPLTSITTRTYLKFEDAPINDTHPTTPDHFEESIDRRRTMARLAEELARLPEREQTIIKSYYFSGRTIQETAAEIGYSEFTTSRFHTRMLRKLREALSTPVTASPSPNPVPAPSSAPPAQHSPDFDEDTLDGDDDPIQTDHEPTAVLATSADSE
jgi:RNA polymerase sigma factor for flagellar operon FliA